MIGATWGEGWGSAALAGDGGRGGDGRLRVEVGTATKRRREVLVEAVEQRDPGRDVQARDLGVANAVEVLDQRSQRVAVRGDEHGPAGAHVRDDLGLPVR